MYFGGATRIYLFARYRRSLRHPRLKNIVYHLTIIRFHGFLLFLFFITLTQIFPFHSVNSHFSFLKLCYFPQTQGFYVILNCEDVRANVQNHDMSAQEPFYGLMAFFTTSPTTNILYGRFFMNTNDLANRLNFSVQKQTTHSPMSARKSISVVLPTATTKTACVCHLWIY